MIYLASPYSHKDEAVREDRFHEVCRSAAKLIAKGILVFSPIAHTHPIAVRGGLGLGFDSWIAFDRWMIERCDGTLVLMLFGWSASVGVAAEVEYTRALGKRVGHISPGNEAMCGSCDAPGQNRCPYPDHLEKSTACAAWWPL